MIDKMQEVVFYSFIFVFVKDFPFLFAHKFCAIKNSAV